MITFTKFRNTKGLLSKTACLEKGELVRVGATQMSQGEYETIQVPFDEFDKFLLNLTTDSALGLGICRQANSGAITSKKRGGAGVTRTIKNFVWPQKKLLVLDFDGGNYATMEEGIEAVVSIVPCLAGKRFWLYPSSGAHLKWEGGSRALTGFHAYFEWDHDVEQLKRELVYWCRVADMESFMISKGLNPMVLTRYPIDLSVFSPERLVYSAGSACGEGVTQNRGLPILIEDDGEWDGTFVSDEYFEAMVAKSSNDKDDFAVLHDLKGKRDVARATRKEKGQLTDVAVEKQETYFANNEVPGSMPITLDTGEQIKAWRILIDGPKWDKVTCHDPFEPDYDGGALNKAVIFADNGSALIVSHAHGTHTYKVVWDQAAILEALKAMNEDDKTKLGEGWLATLYTAPSITEVERQDLLTPMQTASGSASLKETKDKIAAGTSAAQRAVVQSKLEKFNERYVTAEVGAGDFRILSETTGTDGFVYYSEQKKQDFTDANAGEKMTVWDGAKPKLVSVAKVWLEWKGRKHYSKVVFNPKRDEREWKLDDGRLVLNLYRGMVCKPEQGRGCGAVRGCFECFFADKGKKLSDGRTGCGKVACKHDVKAGGGVTFWLQHILEMVAHGSVPNGKWIVDWISDCIRNAGATEDRPGTSLVVYGEEKGTGKGATIWPALALLNGAALHTSDTEDFVGRFNDQLERTILIYANEATWGKGKAVASRLKYLITEPILNIEPKNKGKYKAPNYLRAFISSNYEKAVPAEMGERRHSCHEIKADRKGDRSWFGQFFYRDDLLPIYLDEMLNAKLGADLTVIPQTDALHEQQSLTSMERVEIAFMAWSLESERLWDKNGIGLQVEYDVLKELLNASKLDKMRHEGHELVTELGFINKFRKLVIKLGGKTFRTNKSRGLLIPPLNDTLRKMKILYGVDQ